MEAKIQGPQIFKNVNPKETGIRKIQVKKFVKEEDIKGDDYDYDDFDDHNCLGQFEADLPVDAEFPKQSKALITPKKIIDLTVSVKL